MEIIPAIMPKNFAELNEKATLFAGLVEAIQIDVMDGEFVPEKSWPFSTDKKIFHEIVSKEKMLPQWDRLYYEADLMIARPETCLKGWIETGIKRIIVHLEAIEDLDYFQKSLDHNKYPSTDGGFAEGFKIGIAINIDTPDESLYKQLNYSCEDGRFCVDFVQFMGINKIGYQGEPFDERVLPKIAKLRAGYGDIIISVDGGVNMQSAPRLLEAGVNRLVVGSALLKSENIPEELEKFKNIS